MSEAPPPNESPEYVPPYDSGIENSVEGDSAPTAKIHNEAPEAKQLLAESETGVDDVVKQLQQEDRRFDVTAAEEMEFALKKVSKAFKNVLGRDDPYD